MEKTRYLLLWKNKQLDSSRSNVFWNKLWHSDETFLTGMLFLLVRTIKILMRVNALIFEGFQPKNVLNSLFFLSRIILEKKGKVRYIEKSAIFLILGQLNFRTVVDCAWYSCGVWGRYKPTFFRPTFSPWVRYPDFLIP